ncbi:hypothetical protein FNF27_02475 [Cafeteria roenbergensis]|nr:hypothetical protein FNF27_02475 [Cafeteria roenbergensis]
MEDARRRLHLRRGSVEERAVRNLVTEATERAAQLRVSDADAVLCALFSQTFGVVVTVRFGGRVATWDVRTGEVRATFRVSHRLIAATGAMGGDDGEAPSAGTGRSLRLGATFRPPDIELTAATLDAHGRRLLTGGIDGSVRMWSIANGDLVRSLPPLASEVTAVTFHSAVGLTRPVVAGAWAGEVAFWRDAGEAALVRPAAAGGVGGGAASGLALDAGAEAAAEAMAELAGYGGSDEPNSMEPGGASAAMRRKRLDGEKEANVLLGLSGVEEDDEDGAHGAGAAEDEDSQDEAKRQRARHAVRAKAARRAVDDAIGQRAALSGAVMHGSEQPAGRTVPRWRPATGKGGGAMNLLDRRVDAIRGRITLVRTQWGGAGMSPEEAARLHRKPQAGKAPQGRVRQRRPSVEGDQLSQDVPLSIFHSMSSATASSASAGRGGQADDLLPRRGAGISGRGNVSAGDASLASQANAAHVESVPAPATVTQEALDARPTKIGTISELVLTAHWARALKRVLSHRVDAARLEREQHSRLVELSMAKSGRDAVGSLPAKEHRASSGAGPRTARGRLESSAGPHRPGSARSVPGRPESPADGAARQTHRPIATPLSGSLAVTRPAQPDTEARRPESTRTALLRSTTRPRPAIPGLQLGSAAASAAAPRGGSARGLGSAAGIPREGGGAGTRARVDCSMPESMMTDDSAAQVASEDRVMDAAARLAAMMDDLVFGGAGSASRAARRAASGSADSRRGDVLCVASGGGRPVVPGDGDSSDDEAAPGEGKGRARRGMGQSSRSAPGSGTSTHGPAWVVTGSADGQLCHWDAVTERPASTWQVHDASGVGTLKPAAVWMVCGLEKQRLVLAGTDGGALHVLDITAGHLVQRSSPADEEGDAGSPSGRPPRLCFKSEGEGAMRPFGSQQPAAGTGPGAGAGAGAGKGGASTGGATSKGWSKAKAALGEIGGEKRTRAGAALGELLRTGFRPLPKADAWGPAAAHGVTAAAADSLEHVLLAGYSHGWARIFDVSALTARPHKLESPLCEIVVSPGGFAVRSVAFLAMTGVEPLFVTCAGIDVSLWTRSGSHVARFGQPSPWPRSLGQDKHARRIARASLALGIASTEEVAGAARRASFLLARARRRGSAIAAGIGPGGPVIMGESQTAEILGRREAEGGDEFTGIGGGAGSGESPSRPGAAGKKGSGLSVLLGNVSVDTGTRRLAFGGGLNAAAVLGKSSPRAKSPRAWLQTGSALRASRRQASRMQAMGSFGSPSESILAPASQAQKERSPTARIRARALAEQEAASAARAEADAYERKMERASGAAKGRRQSGRRGSTSTKLDDDIRRARDSQEAEGALEDEAQWLSEAKTAAGRRLLPGPDSSLAAELHKRADRLREMATSAGPAGDDTDAALEGRFSPQPSPMRRALSRGSGLTEAGAAEGSLPARPHRPGAPKTPRDTSAAGRAARTRSRAAARARRAVADIVGPPLGSESDRLAQDDVHLQATAAAGRPLPRHARVQHEYVGGGVWKHVPMDAPRNREGYDEAAEIARLGPVDRLAMTLEAAEAEARRGVRF